MQLLLSQASILVILTLNVAGYTLLVQHTLHLPGPKYSSTVLVLYSEILKLIIALLMVLKEQDYNISHWLQPVCQSFSSSSKNFFKLSIPAAIYTLQNNFIFIGLSNLDAATYQVTYQLKILWTAIFMVIFLKKHIPIGQWLALFLLFAGVVSVQLDVESNRPAIESPTKQNYWLGLGIVLLSSATSGFSGVYFEKVLKNSQNNSFWIANIHLYMWGILFGLCGVVYQDSQAIRATSLYNGYLVSIIVMSSVGGIVVALTIQTLDNIWKSFASSAAVVVAAIGSAIFLGVKPGIYFHIGTVLVCTSTLLFALLSPKMLTTSRKLSRED